MARDQVKVSNTKKRRNTLYIMTGLPYSGKTTLTKKLVERFGWEVVSVDEIMDREKMWGWCLNR